MTGNDLFQSLVLLSFFSRFLEAIVSVGQSGTLNFSMNYAHNNLMAVHIV